MSTPASNKLAAYTTVCSTFAKACEDQKVDPLDCWQAIGRLLGFQPSTSPVASVEKARDSKPTQREIREAKRRARSVKAKTLGLSIGEVNLTSAEAKEVVRSLRGSGGSSRGASTSSGQVPFPSSLPNPLLKTAGSGPEEKKEGNGNRKPVGVTQKPSGARSTAKTRLDNLRRNCLRQSPVAVADPTGLHLLAFCNHRNRLMRQWEEYRRTYQDSGMLNPLRNLPDPRELPKTSQFLEALLKQVSLAQQANSPGTFVLQTESGASFWNRDLPDEANCPSPLRQSLPAEVYNELEEASSGST